MIVKGHTVRSDIDTLHKSSKYLSHPLEQTSKVRVKIIVTLTFRNICIYAYTAIIYKNSTTTSWWFQPFWKTLL